MVKQTAWQPDPKVVKQLNDEFAKAYMDGCRFVPDGYEPYLLEYAKIAAFLQDEPACLIQLKRLNKLVEQEAKERGLNIDETESSLGHMQHKKVLRNVLERELAKVGFQPEFGKATGFLYPEIFRSAISKGLILKDPGVILQHGEFTHAIQWLLIGWQQADTPFLQEPVIESFKRLGDDRSVFLKFPNEENLWDLIVDYRSDLSQTFRSPEILHLSIVDSNDPELKTLKKLCAERMNKRGFGIFSDSASKTHREYERSPESDSLLLPVPKKK